MAVQQGRSERRGEAYSAPYGEPLSDARTPLADFFSILLANGAGHLKHRQIHDDHDTSDQYPHNKQ
jgi:hypothetical protein